MGKKSTKVGRESRKEDERQGRVEGEKGESRGKREWGG